MSNIFSEYEKWSVGTFTLVPKNKEAEQLLKAAKEKNDLTAFKSMIGDLNNYSMSII